MRQRKYPLFSERRRLLPAVLLFGLLAAVDVPGASAQWVVVDPAHIAQRAASGEEADGPEEHVIRRRANPPAELFVRLLERRQHVDPRLRRRRWAARRIAARERVVEDHVPEPALEREDPGELARGLALRMRAQIRAIGRICAQYAHRDGVLALVRFEEQLLG